MLKEKTVCFSGHRPHKLIQKGASAEKVLPLIRSMLYYEIEQAVIDGFDCFISGMAVGVDLWAARYVMGMKSKYPFIKLICAIPYADQGKNLRGEDLFEYSTIKNNADKVIVLSEKYYSECFKRRNKYMVDNSSRLIAVVSDYRSGTGQTINYAKKSGLDLHIVDAKKCCETQILSRYYSSDPD